MSSPWKPISGKPGFYTCAEHGGEFPRGHHCSQCATGSVSYGKAANEADQIAKAASKRGLPTMLDHEEWFLGIAGKAERLADDIVAAAGGVDPDHGQDAERGAGRGAVAVQRLLETAIKARSRAAALTEWREDWERTERLRRLNARFANAGRDATASQDPGGAN